MRTLKKWNKRGRRIIKGSKASGFTVNGKALFKKSQTYKVRSYKCDVDFNDWTEYDENADVDYDDELMFGHGDKIW